jgi:hypothetical protein
MSEPKLRQYRLASANPFNTPLGEVAGAPYVLAANGRIRPSTSGAIGRCGIWELSMGRSSIRSKARESEFVLFDVVYEDGTRSSNRKVPRSELSGLDGDTPAKAFIEAQDETIAQRSGRSRGPIKSIERSAT